MTTKDAKTRFVTDIVTIICFILIAIYWMLTKENFNVFIPNFSLLFICMLNNTYYDYKLYKNNNYSFSKAEITIKYSVNFIALFGIIALAFRLDGFLDVSYLIVLFIFLGVIAFIMKMSKKYK